LEQQEVNDFFIKYKIDTKIRKEFFGNYTCKRIKDNIQYAEEAFKVRTARTIVKKSNPSLIVVGVMQGIVAFNKEIMKENYPFSELAENGEVNTLIFPNLSAGNIAYNLLQEVGEADAIGPILLGLKKPVHVLQLGSSIRSILNMVMISVIDAQYKMRKTERI
jgi:malate dehydrogenase (oxaloacetate-decarboxylating)(NADP+)